MVTVTNTTLECIFTAFRLYVLSIPLKSFHFFFSLFLLNINVFMQLHAIRPQTVFLIQFEICQIQIYSIFIHFLLMEKKIILFNAHFFHNFH